MRGDVAGHSPGAFVYACAVRNSMAVKVKRERADQRRHHRVTAPLFVWIDGKRYRATDWSLGGLRVDGYPGELPGAGAELKFHLTLPFQGFDVSFDVKAEVVRISQETQMVAVRFTEIGERERELMQHFIEELIRGSMSDVEDTIQRIDVPVTPAKLEPDTKNLPSSVPLKRWPVKTVVMTSIYGLAGFVIFGYASLLGYSNFYRMEIQTAVISAPIETVMAQTDGQVVWAGVKPGDEIKAGDVVVNVVDNVIEREIELAGIAVLEQKAKLAYLKQRQADELERVRGYAAVELRGIAQAKTGLEGLVKQLDLAKEQYERLKGLADKGYAPQSKVDDAKKSVLEIEANIESRKIDLTSRADLADQNFGKRLFTGNDIVGQSADVEAQVRLAEHQTELAQRRAESYVKERTRAAITSPFDGTILELPRANLGLVRKGDTIAVLEQRKSRKVTAYLTQDEVLKVGLGDEAILFLPGLGETLKARVTLIDRTTGFVRAQDQRSSPGYAWRGPVDRSAKIELEFADPAQVEDYERYRAGLPVVVVFEQRSTNSLLSTLKKKFTISL